MHVHPPAYALVINRGEGLYISGWAYKRNKKMLRKDKIKHMRKFTN